MSVAQEAEVAAVAAAQTALELELRDCEKLVQEQRASLLCQKITIAEVRELGSLPDDDQQAHFEARVDELQSAIADADNDKAMEMDMEMDTEMVDPLSPWSSNQLRLL